MNEGPAIIAFREQWVMTSAPPIPSRQFLTFDHLTIDQL
jgi:hypothetical protein